jgi:hypothetical protein
MVKPIPPKDTISVLICQPGSRTTKIITRIDTGIVVKGFSAGMYFTSRSYPVNNIRELSVVLTTLESLSNALVIRGTAHHDLDVTKPHQRTKYQPPNYATPHQGRYYFQLDVDKLQLPSGKKLTRRTVENVLKYVVGKLPTELQEVSYHWQLSSSAGINDSTKVSVHLWFWLTHPVPDGDLKRWGKHVNAQKGFKLIDTALFNDVQAHYTAAPIFKNMQDPFPRRSGLTLKRYDEATLVIPSASTSIVQPSLKQKAGSSVKQNRTTTLPESTGTGFEHHLNAIGDHSDGEGFHAPILRATASYVATHKMDDAAKEKLFDLISDRVLTTDASQHEPDYIEQKASRENIMAAIDGAITKFGDNTRPKVTRLLKLPKAEIKRNYVTPEEARKAIRRTLLRHL